MNHIELSNKIISLGLREVARQTGIDRKKLKNYIDNKKIWLDDYEKLLKYIKSLKK